MKRYTFLLAALASFFSGLANAGSLYFNDPTDNVGLNTGTTIGTTMTIEAVFALTLGNTGSTIFTEWTGGQEDKVLAANSSAGIGFAFPNSPGSFLAGSAAISLNAWHHLAYTIGGGTERLFLDGILIANRAGSSDVGDGAGLPFLGAIFRDGGVNPSFIGYLDSFRLSSTNRYTANFVAPIGDLGNDANTLILFNFNEGTGTTINNAGSIGGAGTFATGFVTASNPVWQTTDPFSSATPEPSSFGLAACGLVALAVSRKRR